MKKRIIQIIIAVLLISVAPFMTNQASAASGNDIVNYSKQFLGIKYLYGGTTTSGFDCSGYTQYVYKNAGITLSRTAATQYREGVSVSKSNLQAGDLVFFNNLGYTSHVGIYVGNNQFISATSSKGIAIVSINDPYYWGKYYIGAKRIISSSVTQVSAPAPKTVSAPVTNGIFRDVSTSHAAYEAIKSLNVKGIINGFENQEFKPEADVTRGQAAAMVNRVLKLTPKGTSKFSDVGTTHQFAKDITAMNERGIIIGYTNGKFGVNDMLTKAQLAIILERAFKITSVADNQAHVAAIYHDVPSTYWAHDEIIALKTIDKTTVFQTSRFLINAKASRAEFSAALYSTIESK